MKSTIISMIIVLILMIVVPLVLFGNNDLARQLGFGGGKSSKKVDLKAKAPKNLTSVVTNEKVEVYKWRDKHGVLQFSNKPPEAGSDSELMVLSPNTNIIDAVKIPEKEEKEEKPPASSSKNPYTPGNMKKLIKKTADLKKLMDDHNTDQQEALDKIIKPKK